MTATGRECLRMPLRVTTTTAPAGTCTVAEDATASGVMWSSVSSIRLTFISLGEIQGMVPPVQNEGSDLLGVPPPCHSPRSPKGAQDQSAGSAPSASHRSTIASPPTGRLTDTAPNTPHPCQALLTPLAPRSTHPTGCASRSRRAGRSAPSRRAARREHSRRRRVRWYSSPRCGRGSTPASGAAPR